MNSEIIIDPTNHAILWNYPTLNIVRSQTVSIVGIRCLNFIAGCTVTISPVGLPTPLPRGSPAGSFVCTQLHVANTGSGTAAVQFQGLTICTLQAGQVADLAYDGSVWTIQS